MVEAEMELFSAALPHMSAADHAILLSGVCHPCRPLPEFLDFLNEKQGQELISYNRLANTNSLTIEPTRTGTWRVKNIFISDILMPPISLAVKIFFGVMTKLNRMEIPSPRFDKKVDYFVGSQWIGCTRNFIELFLKNRRYIRKRFRWVFAPDELAIQSYCIWLSRERADIKVAFVENKDIYAVIDAPYHYIKGGSTVITMENLNEIVNSGKYFVRKPNAELRSKLKELIISRN
jgi:hypothetical protein